MIDRQAAFSVLDGISIVGHGQGDVCQTTPQARLQARLLLLIVYHQARNCFVPSRTCDGLSPSGRAVHVPNCTERRIDYRWSERSALSLVPLAGHKRSIRWMFSVRTKNCERIVVIRRVGYCPEGKPLRYSRVRRRGQGYIYSSTAVQCRGCPQKQHCTSAPFRNLVIHWHEQAREVVRGLVE
jgi:hypothetical protein